MDDSRWALDCSKPESDSGFDQNSKQKGAYIIINVISQDPSSFLFFFILTREESEERE